MPQSRSLQLVKKSIDCMVSAIELYNKPDFKYREETFSVMAVNAWELLLKAKLLKDGNNNLTNIYVRQSIKGKNGKPTRKWKWKESRSGNKLTVEIIGALKKLTNKKLIDPTCQANIEVLIEIRDNAIHFYNKDKLLTQKIQEVGMASIKSYLTLINEWFSIDLQKFNFYLMPLSFFNPKEFDPVILGNIDPAMRKLLKFIAEKESQFPSDPASKHNISIIIETKIVKSSSLDAQSVRISNDPNAPVVSISLEDVKKTHPLDYKELTAKMRIRYKDFKLTDKYHEIRKILEDNPQYCFKYLANPLNPEGTYRAFFSPSIFSEFDKHYKQKISPKTK